jgi:iron complex transport system substrate-binding protein
VLTLDPHSLDGVLSSVLDVGDVLGVAERAHAVVDSLRARLDALTRVLAGTAPRSVLVLEWTDPPFCAGHWVPDLVAAGGGTAALAVPGGDSHRITWDEVRTAPADVVLVAPCGYHLEPATAFAEQLVAEDRLPVGAEVWAVDADSHFVRPGPRVVDGAEVVAQILHPARVGPPAADRARRAATVV